MRNKTGRPDNQLLMIRNYHDLERRSLLVEHSESTRLVEKAVLVSEVSSDTTLNAGHELVLVDCSGGMVTITLPAAATYPFKQYRIKKVDSTNNPVKVKPQSAEYIDDEDEWLITFQFDCMDIVSDSVDEWFMV